MEECKLKRKLIVYVDGSFAEGKGGWCFLYYYRQSSRKCRIAYGNCSADNNVQMELIACIKFLVNILRDMKPHIIEIRTDYIKTAQFFEQKWFDKLNNGQRGEIPVGAINKAAAQWYRFYNIVEDLKCKIKFTRVNRTHKRLRIVDKIARNALYIDTNESGYWFKDYNTDDFIIVEDKDIDTYENPPEIWLEAISGKMWFENQPVTMIPIKDVVLVESIHLKASYLDLNGYLARLYLSKQIDTPIAVRCLPEGKYGLVAGFSRLCLGKICDIDEIPAVFTELSWEEFTIKYGL